MISYSKTTNKYFHNEIEITKEEYESIKEMIKNKPIPPIGYDYYLSDSLEWVLYETDIAVEEVE